MTKQEYEDALSDFGADVAAGELTSQQAEATVLLNGFADTGSCPSSLRAPLRAVREGTEVPGTAEDVLRVARDLLVRGEA